MPSLSIITPTYNRPDTLYDAFESLVNQTNYDFEWIVVDDGSDHSALEMMPEIMEKATFPIKFIRKRNGGKHTALNYAHPYVNGDFVLILDDDDMLVDNAVDTILSCWSKYDRNPEIACISFMKGSSENAPLREWAFESPLVSNHIDFRLKKRFNVDCAEVTRTDVFKRYPFPVFAGEKYLAEGHLWINIAYEYKTVYINKVVYLCKYLDDGLTKSGRKLRLQNPQGGMYICSLYFNKRMSTLQRIKHYILYDCYAIETRQALKHILSAGWILPCAAFYPAGYLLNKKWNHDIRTVR